MENNAINIAALLKDCSKGTKLYSPICGECEFIRIEENKAEEYPIITRGAAARLSFTEYGKYFTSACECLLFPSKEVRDWGLFKVKYVKGNFERAKELKQLLINNGAINPNDFDCSLDNTIYFIESVSHEVYEAANAGEEEFILATGTELKLEEKEEPKFKVGDVIVDVKDNVTKHPVHSIIENSQKPIGSYEFTLDYANTLKIRLALPEEIAKWNEVVLQPNHRHYSTSKRKIIDWFLSKDDVVVRSGHHNAEWRLARFSHYSHNNIGGGRYCADCHFWYECLPYNERTAKLIGTTDDYDYENG